MAHQPKGPDGPRDRPEPPHIGSAALTGCVECKAAADDRNYNRVVKNIRRFDVICPRCGERNEAEHYGPIVMCGFCGCDFMAPPPGILMTADQVGGMMGAGSNPAANIPQPDTATKADDGKVRLELLPPEFLEGVGEILTFGAKKYGVRNWEKGMDYGRVYGALQRHLLAWWSGQEVDAETGKSHLYHAGCCLAFLATYQARGIGRDDRPGVSS